jgi:hypothetical protein
VEALGLGGGVMLERFQIKRSRVVENWSLPLEGGGQVGVVDKSHPPPAPPLKGGEEFLSFDPSVNSGLRMRASACLNVGQRLHKLLRGSNHMRREADLSGEERNVGLRSVSPICI